MAEKETDEFGLNSRAASVQIARERQEWRTFVSALGNTWCNNTMMVVMMMTMTMMAIFP